ncbi:unnamed protein product, partial [Mesorhabditis belari]|uniref:Uncharacterized protein n=1 Tax=Mesorhabditis belari TaxID=2138241 RepID=A0AAF3FM54_9BILA
MSLPEIADEIPFHLQILNNSVLYGNDKALSDVNGCIHYTDLRPLSNRYANALRVFGIKRGDNVLIVFSNRNEYPLVFLGAALLGATISGASPQLTRDEIDHLCKEANSKLVIVEENVEYFQETGEIKILNINEFLSIVNEASSNPSEIENSASLDDVLIEPFSSGTTGLPKCVQLTHRNYISATKSLSEALFSKLSLTKGRRCTLAFLPFYHGSGFWALVYCLLAGHHSVIQNEFHPLIMMKAIEEHKVDVINVVPSIVSALLRLPIDSFNLSSLSLVLVGSAPLGRELSEAFMNKFPQVKHLIQGYGMSEVVVLSHLTPLEADSEQWGSCGRLLPGSQGKLIDDDGNEVKEDGQWGELFLKSEAVFKGYKGGQESGKDKEGWLRTGDIAYKDLRDFYFIVDRKKDLIKVNGLQVAPAQLEEVLLTHPNIAEAVVVRTEHPQYGEVPKAFIIAAEGMTIDPKEIQDYVKERVAPFKQLRGGIVLCNELPKTKSGKIAKSKLQDYQF